MKVRLLTKPVALDKSRTREPKKIRIPLIEHLTGLPVKVFFSKYTKQFLEAAENGNLEKVKEFVESRIDINATDKIFGSSALIRASTAGHLEVVKFLVESGADVNLLDDLGSSALIHASGALRENTEIVKVLIESDADLEWKNYLGTALHHACRRGNYKTAKLLIESGADVNAIEDKGRTPLLVLTFVAPKLRKEIVELLLDQGAELNAKNDSGSTILHLFCGGYRKHEPQDKQVVELLIKKGVELNAKDSEGKTPLDHAHESGLNAIAEFLIKSGAKE